MQIVLTPEVLLAAYSQGLFPMAHSGNSEDVHWVCPELRGQLSITEMHIPKSLRKIIRQGKIKGVPYEIKINTDFDGVISACALETNTRVETWINPQIKEAFYQLHKLGFAHSVECWQEGDLVGGLYGMAIGGAFFGESMFSFKTQASKVALVHLVARLHGTGYSILDTQFTNEHLEQFGVYEISHEDYMERLESILNKPCDFNDQSQSEEQRIKQYFDMRYSNKS